MAEQGAVTEGEHPLKDGSHMQTPPIENSTCCHAEEIIVGNSLETGGEQTQIDVVKQEDDIPEPVADCKVIIHDVPVKTEPELQNSPLNAFEMSQRPENIETMVYDISSDSSEDDDNDPEDDDWTPGTHSTHVGNQPQKLQPPKPKRPCLPPAKTAREFFQRKKEKQLQKTAEDATRNCKRQSNSNHARPQKRLRTGVEANSGLAAQLERELEAGGSESLQAVEDNPSLQKAPKIISSTQKEQFASMMKSIPPGSDLRRANTQARDLKQAVKSFGFRQVKALNGKWLHVNMKTPLHSFQITAVAWMLERELIGSGPAGGIIADEMGMGKTIMSLACIVSNPPHVSDKDFIRTTLIIVPNAVVAKQWEEEAKKHMSEKFPGWVDMYNTKGQMTTEKIEHHSILITTIFEVRRQFISAQEVKIINKKSGQDYLTALDEAEKGQLFSLNWYRIILDEAHAIKNTHSLSKLACCYLKAKHRWGLTGTPLSNSTEEVLPYLKFIGCDIDEDADSFKRQYMREAGPSERETRSNDFHGDVSKASCKPFLDHDRLSFHIRTKNDSFIGYKILDLPECNGEVIHIRLSQEEQVVYRFVKEIFVRLAEQVRKEEQNPVRVADQELQSRLKKELDQLFFEQMIHLRLMTSHTYNIERLLRKEPTIEHLQEVEKELREIPKKTLLQQLLADQDTSKKLEKYSSGLDFLKSQSDPSFGGVFDFDTYLRLIEAEREAQQTQCCACKQKNPERPVKNQCGHMYCHECFQERYQIMRFAYPTQVSEQQYCIEAGCKEPLLASVSFHPMSVIAHEAATSTKYRELGIDNNKVCLPRDKDRNGCFLVSNFRTDVPRIPSSRLTVIMAILSTWRSKYSDDKILVFTQFITTAKVLGRMLQSVKMPFLYYFGCMSPSKKSAALEIFKDAAQDKKIMLISLRSGGQSLNLACANRVIIVEPWWNHVAEAQAIGRAHRIGQTKPCHVVRLYTDADMDIKMNMMQEKKSVEIDWALQDDGHSPSFIDDEQRQELFEFTTGKTKGKPGPPKQQWRGSSLGRKAREKKDMKMS